MQTDFYRPDVTATEDVRDAYAVQVEPSFSTGILSQPSKQKTESSEAGEETAPEASALRVSVRSHYDNSGYADEEEEPRPITIEEFVRHSTRDTKAAMAFKSVVNELISRTSHSRVSAVRNCSLPSTCDFSADVALCAKRSLGPHIYRIFCWAVDSQFERWHEVPDSLRKIIVEKTGALLLERGIFSRGGTTRAYWTVGRKQRAPKPAQQLEAA